MLSAVGGAGRRCYLLEAEMLSSANADATSSGVVFAADGRWCLLLTAGGDAASDGQRCYLHMVEMVPSANADTNGGCGFWITFCHP
jgi:hypothetical protein